MKTYVFVRPNGDYLTAYGDLYQLIDDLYDTFESGATNIVYETDLMPDQVNNLRKLRIERKLKYVTLYTKY